MCIFPFVLPEFYKPAFQSSVILSSIKSTQDRMNRLLKSWTIFFTKFIHNLFLSNFKSCTTLLTILSHAQSPYQSWIIKLGIMHINLSDLFFVDIRMDCSVFVMFL